MSSLHLVIYWVQVDIFFTYQVNVDILNMITDSNILVEPKFH